MFNCYAVLEGMAATSDLESSDSEEESETEYKQKGDGKPKSILKPSRPCSANVSAKAEDQDLEKVIETAKKELPYTFKAPEGYDDFLMLMEGHSEKDQLIIIDRLRKCHHPSLAEGNKEKLETIFACMLQYFGEMAIQKTPQLTFIDKLVIPLYEMTQQSPITAGKTLQELLLSQHEMFRELRERRNGKGIFPTLDTLMLLKLVSVLFPTSDFKHPVVTPAILFLGEIITQCPVSTTRDIASGLFVCTLFLEYVSYSKRFVPEVINFLHGTLFMATVKDSSKIESVFLPHKPVGKNIDLLTVENKSHDVEIQPLNLSQLFSIAGRKLLDSDSFRVQSVAHTLSMLTSYSKLYSFLPSAADIFKPIKDMCEKLPLENYPNQVQELQEEFLEQYESLVEKRKSRRPLTMPWRKPQPIQMFEPKIADSFDGKKIRGGTREFNEKRRELHKYKKELKGARKEIIKDMQFVHDQKLKEQEQRDSDRKRKVKQIYHQLATQEGDYKAMKRQKDN